MQSILAMPNHLATLSANSMMFANRRHSLVDGRRPATPLTGVLMFRSSSHTASVWPSATSPPGSLTRLYRVMVLFLLLQIRWAAST